MQISKLSLFFHGALIVFDLYSFEKKNPNFLDNHTEIQKIFVNKIELEFNFTYAVQISLRSVHK